MSGPRAVAIVGRSHSGSTLLSLLLAGRPGVVAIGEASSMPSVVRRDPGRARAERCSCGVPAGSCELWGPVIAELERDADAPVHRLVADRLVEVQGPDVVIVDESKRLDALRAMRGAVDEVTVIRLARDVRADVAGRLRRTEVRRHHEGRRGSDLGERLREEVRHRRATSATWLFLDWHRDNRMTDEVLARAGYPVVHTSYEHLTAAPSAELPRLAAALGLADPERIDLRADGSHLVFGNNMRHHAELGSTIRGDLRWLTEPRWVAPSLLLRGVMRYNTRLVYETPGALDSPGYLAVSPVHPDPADRAPADRAPAAPTPTPTRPQDHEEAGAR